MNLRVVRVRKDGKRIDTVIDCENAEKANFTVKMMKKAGLYRSYAIYDMGGNFLYGMGKV